ncbi:MAG: hypothetical protein JW876_00495 [Candidatus Krumholzibacteriota bacterium]|nr:hypothetical protein [Candidatus Krumholzibacteriota bacterium]
MRGMRTWCAILPLFGSIAFLHSIPSCIYEPTTPRGYATAWTWTEQASGTSDFLHDVWGSAGDDVLAVGDNGTILRYDGESWHREGDFGIERIRGIWGSSATDVWAVGDSIRHRDGGRWTTVPAPPGPFLLHEVWGRSAGDVFAVGADGVILHFDGDSWQRMPSGTGHDLYAVGGLADGPVYVGGDRGILLALDGATWRILLYDAIGRSDIDFTGMAAVPGVGVFLAGGPRIYRWDGERLETSLVAEDTWFRDIAARPGRILYAAGEGGDYIRRSALGWMSQWMPMRPSGRHKIFAVWGSAEGDLFAVGSYGSILFARDQTTTRTLAARSTSTIASVTRWP